MKINEWLSLVLSVTAIIIIPIATLAIRSAIRWTRIEEKVKEITTDLKDLVESKDKVHLAIYEQMRVDRSATDRRLRWLEEHLWKKGA